MDFAPFTHILDAEIINPESNIKALSNDSETVIEPTTDLFIITQSEPVINSSNWFDNLVVDSTLIGL